MLLGDLLLQHQSCSGLTLILVLSPYFAVVLHILINLGSESQGNGALFSVMQTIGTTLGYMFVGRLSEIYGRRWVMIAFTLFGLIGCTLSIYPFLNIAYSYSNHRRNGSEPQYIYWSKCKLLLPFAKYCL